MAYRNQDSIVKAVYNGNTNAGTYEQITQGNTTALY